ncbi:hypothetical protein P872_07675 [Rhodonellum psychrophilum GCM71 = DSM 17998]|uniref:Uncharacterized protein n=1 Tax=Rhodonellum psychrophilum GCM71 = DSM 17998 TaxID=1123057 RepID=U5BYS3_9BACT|nr:hypothetical protein P872_07675 [Rhodonellum psychrophilum GCM71 = DSM 17998]
MIVFFYMYDCRQKSRLMQGQFDNHLRKKWTTVFMESS